jgi:hypothetical protein
MAVPVAAHIPGWGLKFIAASTMEIEEDRMRRPIVGGSSWDIVSDCLSG